MRVNQQALHIASITREAMTIQYRPRPAAGKIMRQDSVSGTVFDLLGRALPGVEPHGIAETRSPPRTTGLDVPRTRR